MVRLVENALVVYTDGSLIWKGRKGGYGLVFVHIDERGNETVVGEHAPPGIAGTTGNRMELQACVDALELSPNQECFGKVNRLVIRTDSQYVVRGGQILGHLAPARLAKCRWASCGQCGPMEGISKGSEEDPQERAC
jgi:ribonuclease HI